MAGKPREMLDGTDLLGEMVRDGVYEQDEAPFEMKPAGKDWPIKPSERQGRDQSGMRDGQTSNKSPMDAFKKGRGVAPSRG